MHSIPADPPRGEPVFVEIAKKMTPAVVNISTTSTQTDKEHSSSDSFYENSFFRKFFREGAPHRRKTEGQVLGSGVIIDPNGYIVTNHHVIAEGQEIWVVLSDRREFSGKVVGSDVKSDLAVIKIDAKDLPAGLRGETLQRCRSGNMRWRSAIRSD
ncbi:MAG: trypsin-like peptidase domain-containing protein [Candidatus Manganitrophus sp.]|nr:trypsin-like peptidase domain-containing protein [Candidatus Manganitrophus sp.]